MFLRSLLMLAGVALAGAALAVITLGRLRDIGLSGAWLMIFPYAPLVLLLSFAIAAVPMVTLATVSPWSIASIWIELAFGLLLALPHTDAAEKNPVLLLMNRIAPRAENIGRGRFALHVALAVALYSGITAASIYFGTTFTSLAALRQQPPLNSLAAGVRAIQDLTIAMMMVFIVSSTIRRLADVNLRPWWVIFFPMGSGSFVATAATLGIGLRYPQMVGFILFTSNPYLLCIYFEGIAFLLVGLFLLFRSGADRSADFHPPAQAAIPAAVTSPGSHPINRQFGKRNSNNA